MRFFKVFVFVFLFCFTLNSMAALTNSQKNYLMQEKGYTGEQIQAYENKVAANQAARKAGQEITALTDSETQLLNDAKSSEAINYGNEAGLWEKFQASLAESTGMADTDMTGTMDALDTAGDVSTMVGLGALGAAGGVMAAGALGAGAAATTAAAVVGGAAAATPWKSLINAIFGGGEPSFPTILQAFTSSTVNNGCWFCGIFKTLFEIINKLAVKLNANLTDMIVGDGWGVTYSLMGILLFGYIIFVVGKAFLSFEPTEPMKLFSDVFFPSMRCMIAALLIWNIQAIYTYMLDPLLMASIGFGQKVMESGSDNYGKSFSGGADLKGGAYLSSVCSNNITFNNSLLVDLTGGPTAQVDFSGNGTSGKFYEYAATNDGLSNGVNNAIQCFLDTASQNLITWMAVGASFIADCWKLGLSKFLEGLQMFIIGVIIFIGSFLIFLAFPLKLLDSMFRLMFITALMPLWIAFWVIPQTRGYTKKAWGMLEHVLITFIVLSVILVMVLTIIEQMFNKDVSGIDINTIAQKLLEDKTVRGLEYINFTGVGIFMTAALMYLAFSLIGKTDSFVSHFASGGGDIGMGKELAGRATQGAQLVGTVGWAATKAGGRLAKKAVPAAINTVGSAAHAVRSYGTKVANAFHEGEAEGMTNPDRNSFAYWAGNKLGGGSGKGPTTGAGEKGEETPTLKPKVSTSSSRETLSDGRTKDTSMKTFTDADGKVTHKEVSDTIKDAKGRVESKSSKRENFDPATGNKTGSSTMETRYNEDGTSTQVKTDFDAMDRKKSILTTTNEGTTKTEFDEAGREKTITMKDRYGNTSVETNNYDASGKRVSFFSESKDAAGKLTEKFKVDLNTNKKIDILTGKVSDYV